MITSSIWDKMHSIQYYVRTVKQDINDRNSYEMIDANRKKNKKKHQNINNLLPMLTFLFSNDEVS